MNFKNINIKPVPYFTYYNKNYFAINDALYYPPFGSSLPNRAWSDVSRGYRYGFNGKEKDSETANDAYDFGARIYDGRLGRWLSVDPLMKKYSEFSPYIISINNPIIFIDIDGRDFIVSNSLFNNYSMYQTYLKVYTNHIILSLIIDIKEDVELTCISPFEDPSNVNICEEKINSTYYGVYTISTKKLNFNPLQSALKNEDIFVATFAHELIHKRIDQMFKLLVNSEGEIVTSYSSEYENFVSILKLYGSKNIEKCHHEYIAKFCLKDIINAMKFQNMDNTGQITDKSGSYVDYVKNESTGGCDEINYTWTSDQYYEAMAWEGLTNTDGFKKLTPETQTLYKKISESQRQFKFTKKDKKE